MPFWRSYAHLVWTTKSREPLISPVIEAPLFACIVSKGDELGCYIHAINGIMDHIHIIISIPPRHSVSWVVKNLKGTSSHFINHELRQLDRPFYWQRGYGYLSLGESRLASAIEYVDRQKVHHTNQTTNKWLEMVEDDETPDDSDGSPALREPGPVYAFTEQDDWPF